MMLRVLVLACLLPNLAWARIDRVLLIGVTDYADEVTEIAQPLQGPGHDVALLLDVFRDAGVPDAAFHLLSDRPGLLAPAFRDRVRLPTRSEILLALDQLAADAEAGQRITIFLAGHGSQLPALRPEDEPDGLDEVFLPGDFTLGGPTGFANQIRDDEIGARIDRMLARGAHVWLIADTCHSGSLRRSDGIGLVPRFLDLQATGSGVSDPQPLITRNGDTPGLFVGFYGAGAGRLAFETRPRDSDTTHGLLTWSLARALREGSARSFRALARTVVRDLWQIGQGRATPGFSGALAAEQMLAPEGADEEGFALSIGDEIEIGGGLIDGLVPGSRIVIDDDGYRPLFQTRITDADLTRARAPLPMGAAPALDARIEAEGLAPDRYRLRWLQDRAPTLSARILTRPFDAALRVDLPADPALGAALRDRLAALAPQIEIVPEGGDVSLEVEAGRLHMRPAAPGAAQAMSLPLEAEALDQLPGLLRRRAKTRALGEVAEALRHSPVTRALDLSVLVTGGQADDQECAVMGSAGAPRKADPLRPATVTHCDQVTLRITNRGNLALDLTPLYLAADHQVYFLSGYPGSERGGWRILPGKTGALSYQEATRTPDGTPLATGPMQLLVLAVVAGEDGDPVDFRYLQEIAPPPPRRAGGAPPLAHLLQTAGFGLALTRAIGQHDQTAGGALVVPLETVPDRNLTQRDP